MFRESHIAPPLRRAGLSVPLLVGLVAGCQTSSPLESAGVALAPRSGWRPVAASRWPVPGVPLAAWSGPAGASLVVYRGLPIPGGTAESLGREIATRLSNLPGLRVIDRRIVTIGGQPAARIEVIAQGTGDMLAPSGAGSPVAPAGRPLIETRRIVVACSQPARSLTFVWHFPASQASARAEVEATLATLTLAEMPASSSSY